jgi:hypothetical protein
MNDFVLAARPTHVWNLYDTMEAALSAKLEADERSGETHEAMSYEDFKAMQKRHFLADPLKEISAADWHYFLEVLPPKRWEHKDGVERFLMSEFTCATFTLQLARWGNRYFSRTVDAFDRSTWITDMQCSQVEAVPA